MEHLWNTRVTTGGKKPKENGSVRELTGRFSCQQLPPVAAANHGNEGVDGSSPSEGTKGQQMAFFVASVAYAHRSSVP